MEMLHLELNTGTKSKCRSRCMHIKELRVQADVL